ncbi:unnamed protein product [Cuscuta campestris]|uniref:Cytochrome P450 n=1 Tax=Cuscuta campestris TaxID=132261 RepID=A0A484N421_9ASTE|nr:unnamed protein product [Cuscuta campestris]
MVKKKNKKQRGKKLPPSPREIPILGHLHLLGKNTHEDLRNLAKVHGPIMRLRLGSVEHVIVSSPRAAELFLKTHDSVFASRPPHEAAQLIAYGQKNLSFSQYGAYWRSTRKICTMQLLTNLKVNSFQGMRMEELNHVIESLKKKVGAAAVDLGERVSALTADMSCRMVFGKKYEMKDIDERGFKGVVREAMRLFTKINLADYFPHLCNYNNTWLDIQGLRRRMKAIAEVFDKLLEGILEDHEQGGAGGGGDSSGRTKDFVEILLAIMKSGESDFPFHRNHVKATLMDIFAASTDTTAMVIEWTMFELMRHPHYMKKVQDELERRVGLGRMVEESDLEGLEYLEMVIKESLRLHPVVPLLAPHEAREDCEVDGFHIPQGTRIFVNVWAIGHDPNVWPDPEKFIPERFQGVETDYRGRHFELVPFGSGRRSCPGMQLGVTVVRLVLAQLLHCFDWKLPEDPQELGLMVEEFGFAILRIKRLVAVPYNYRLHI